MNTKKATVITDEKGRTLRAGAFRPGRMHDQTAVRTEGIADLLRQHPQVRAKADAGYRGLAKEFPDQVQAPPLKPTPSTSNGASCSGSPDAATTSTRPTWPSPAWSPTAPPSGNHQPARQASTPQH